MAILIKRYANRKLYNTDASRYITLKGIAELLDTGEEVRVVDNETGEDITSVALSQILVDRKRSNTTPSDTLLSQIFGRGGDVLYGALRKSMDDAQDGIGEIQDRVRRIVKLGDRGEPETKSSDKASNHERRRFSDWLAHASPDLEHLIQNAVEQVFRLLDLPRRSDVEALNANLERVARAIETLESSWTRREETAETDTAACAGSDAPDSVN
jgi:polyhydroxyalkanoate synthesis repressor PhaR